LVAALRKYRKEPNRKNFEALLQLCLENGADKHQDN
jgi:hypothetical protein